MTTERATGTLVWVRAFVLAAVALATGAVAHVQADGLLPGTDVLLVVTALGALACAPLLTREVSTPRLVVLLVAGQSVVHLVLSVTAGHRGQAASAPTIDRTPVTPMPTGRRGSYFDVAYAPAAGQHDAGLSVPAPLLHAFGDVTAHPGMALAHVLAAAACGWWLAQGERALWDLLRLAGRTLFTHLVPAWRWTVPAFTPLLAAPAHADDVRRPLTRIIARSVTRRGPPRLA